MLGLVLQGFAQHQDWRDPQGLVMVASLAPDTNPLCLAGDGDRHPPGTREERPYLEHLRYGNCDCCLLPVKGSQGIRRDQRGKLQPSQRPAIGDNGEESILVSIHRRALVADQPQNS